MSIGEKAFSSCSSLTNITISNGVKSIDKNAFEYCSKLTDITLPSSLTSMGDYLFYYCKALTNVTFEEDGKITYLNDWTFNNCDLLTNLVLPKSITDISNTALLNCKNVKFNEKDGLRYLGTKSNPYFYLVGKVDDNVNEINIDENCMVIGKNALTACYSLTSLNIPSNVTTIGKNAFKSCVKLESVVVPSSVNYIGEGAFGSTKLTSLAFADASNWFSGDKSVDVSDPEQSAKLMRGACGLNDWIKK